MITAAVLLFEGAELLDVTGPYEVFASVRRQAGDGVPLARAVAVAATPRAVRTANGLALVPEAEFATAPPADVVIVPGGAGTRDLAATAAAEAFLRARAPLATVVASVCTGSFVLARAGLLPDGSRVTSYWGALERLRAEHPRLDVVGDVRFTELPRPAGGLLFTSAGVSAGIDMALAIVARLLGADVARATAREMEYTHWDG